jgi:hypothetical protein
MAMPTSAAWRPASPQRSRASCRRSAISISFWRSRKSRELGRRRFRQLRPLATPDHWHAPIGQGSTVGLCRLPGIRLRFELLRPTSLKSVHDVPRQVRSSHIDDPCKPIARDEAGAAALRPDPWVAVDHSTRKGLSRSIPSDGSLRFALKLPHPGRARARCWCPGYPHAFAA